MVLLLRMVACSLECKMSWHHCEMRCLFSSELCVCFFEEERSLFQPQFMQESCRQETQPLLLNWCLVSVTLKGGLKKLEFWLINWDPQKKKTENNHISHVHSSAKFMIIGYSQNENTCICQGFQFLRKFVQPYCCLAWSLRLEGFSFLDINLCTVTYVPIAIMLIEDGIWPL